jgi:hypothetical protein
LSIEAYLGQLPDDRRKALEALRKTVKKHLPKGYEESFAFNMITWQVPLSVYPDTYNKQPLMYAALASQKNHLALYLCNAYAMPPVRKLVESGFKKAGKKLDMGKSCIRFKSLDDLPLDVIGAAIAATPMKSFVAHVKKSR